VPILDLARLPRLARREKATIAILAVPARAAQKVLDQVSRAGIRAVLNFAPAQLKVDAAHCGIAAEIAGELACGHGKVCGGGVGR